MTRSCEWAKIQLYVSGMFAKTGRLTTYKSFDSKQESLIFFSRDRMKKTKTQKIMLSSNTGSRFEVTELIQLSSTVPQPAYKSKVTPGQ